MAAIKIRRIGNSLGVILPKEALARLGVGEGDSVFAHEAPDGLVLTKADDDFARKMEMAREIMREYRNVLSELAK